MAVGFIRKVGAAGAAVAAVGGISFGASAFASGPGPSGHHTAAPAAAPVAHKPAAPVGHKAAAKAAAPTVVRQLIGKGEVHGTAWSVTLEFYPTLPEGYVIPSFSLPGVKAVPAKKVTALVCQRMVIDGVRVDHQGGPWADCQPVDGAQDRDRSREAGLWGMHDKGTSGFRLFVANPDAQVARAVVTLTDGTRLTARTVTAPATAYRAWAVAIPSGETIAAVDQYDVQDHRISHETEWR
ncbi:hypothetical protein [Actinacidiphila paucisporea]|uniref:Uncharacterized protein n=1 Tax=Actinacidiphila paucisporea TaxID=310782 RepID=A0A1M7NXT0_9ACTN|nr:hypothetical protein [Actinacidiphila paucisporea]SHN09042.1 hypothetical protein SAMN05216499_12054 [Actinacidiphila paucisporea]